MAIEIERRFLAASDAWRDVVRSSRHIEQGYLAREGGVAVRVRMSGRAGWLTVKGPGGVARPEFEYPVPAEEAEALLALCGTRRLAKTRHEVEHGGRLWEVDVFEGPLAGLVIAEVELPEAAAPLALPAWVGAEVTDDPRYRNAVLATAERPPA